MSFADLQPQTQKRVLSYHRGQDAYYVESPYRILDTKPLTANNLKTYLNEDYQTLFDEFDPSTDLVATNHNLDQPYLLHQRAEPKPEASIPPPGLYRFQQDNRTPYIQAHPFPSRERYIPLTNNVEAIHDDIRRFFEQKQLYRNLGMNYSRGCLLHGPPGNGKTFSMLHAMKLCIERFDCRVFYIPDMQINLQKLHAFREPLENLPTILLFEELTRHTRRNPEGLLSLLDGETSWINNYTIATTNDPEKLPQNLVQRPGRFDRVFEVSPPDAQSRKKYLCSFLSEDEVRAEVIQQTEGFSVAHLKEVILRSHLYDQTLDQSIQEFRELNRKIDDGFQTSGNQPGFISRTNGDEG